MLYYYYHFLKSQLYYKYDYNIIIDQNIVAIKYFDSLQ